MRMPFGKHVGKELDDIPDAYLLWILDNIEELSETLREAIEERLGLIQPEAGAISAEAASQLIRAWHRQMTMKYHPDRGGSHEAMIAINDGVEVFKSIAGIQ